MFAWNLTWLDRHQERVLHMQNASPDVPEPCLNRRQMAPIRLLIAGVGNLLRGDDGFGVVLALRLMENPPQIAGVTITIIETGIGGIHLVQELLTGYDALVILDAVERGGAPGTLYLLEPERAEPAAWTVEVRRDFFADTHYAEPSRALALAEAIGVQPARVLVVGCQIQVESVEQFLQELTPAVTRAVGHIERQLPHLIANWLSEHEYVTGQDETVDRDPRHVGDSPVSRT